MPEERLTRFAFSKVSIGQHSLATFAGTASQFIDICQFIDIYYDHISASVSDDIRLLQSMSYLRNRVAANPRHFCQGVLRHRNLV